MGDLRVAPALIWVWKVNRSLPDGDGEKEHFTQRKQYPQSYGGMKTAGSSRNCPFKKQG